MAGYFVKHATPVQSMKDALNAETIPFTINYEDTTNIVLGCPTYFGDKIVRFDFDSGECYVGDSYINATSLGNQKTIYDHDLSNTTAGQFLFFITDDYFAFVTNAESNATDNTLVTVFCKSIDQRYVLSFSNATAVTSTYCYDLTTLDIVIPILSNGHNITDSTGKFISSDIFFYKYTTRVLYTNPLIGLKNVFKAANFNWAWESYGSDVLCPCGYIYDERFYFNSSILLKGALVGGNVA